MGSQRVGHYWSDLAAAAAAGPLELVLMWIIFDLSFFSWQFLEWKLLLNSTGISFQWEWYKKPVCLPRNYYQFSRYMHMRAHSHPTPCLLSHIHMISYGQHFWLRHSPCFQEAHTFAEETEKLVNCKLYCHEKVIMRTSQVRCYSRVEEYLMQTGGERELSLSNNWPNF